MKRTACWACLVMACLSVSTACQPTPERAPVVNKGEGKYEQELQEAQEREKNSKNPGTAETPSPYAHLAHWSESLDLPNFSVNIDADVEVPEKNTFPVYRVEGVRFSKQTDALPGILNALIQDANGVRSGGMTREECSKKIIYLQLGRYDSELMKYVPYTPQEQEEADTEISALNKLMETAPSEDDYSPLTGGLHTDAPSDYVYHTKSGKQWEVIIDESTVSISQPGERSYPESMFIHDKASPGRPAPTPYQNILISEDEARDTVNSFFSAINDDTWVITNIERSGMTKEYYNVLTDYHNETEGWQVDCMRSGESAVLFDYHISGGERLHFSEAAYSAPLPLESLQLFVDENGIYTLWWNNPLEVTGTVAENISLLPFEEVQSIFVQTMRNGLSWAADYPSTNGELNPTRKGIVERILLSYSYVQERDNPGRFLMTPTWFFWYTTEAAKNAMSEGYVVDPVIIAINAVDGSRIELQTLNQ